MKHLCFQQPSNYYQQPSKHTLHKPQLFPQIPGSTLGLRNDVGSLTLGFQLYMVSWKDAGPAACVPLMSGVQPQRSIHVDGIQMQIPSGNTRAQEHSDIDNCIINASQPHYDELSFLRGCLQCNLGLWLGVGVEVRVWVTGTVRIQNTEIKPQTKQWWGCPSVKKVFE